MIQSGLFEEPQTNSLRPSWAWQERTLEAIRQAVREGCKRIVVQSPTGAGKTRLASDIFAMSIAKGKRPLFCVPDITLVEQTLRSFERVGIRDIGIIQAQHIRTDREAAVQIASIQTLIRRALPDVDLIIVDECHVQNKALLKIMEGPQWAGKVVIGLSATPWARGMGEHWDKLIIGATIRELIDEKILCGFRVYVPAEEADFSKLHIKAGEFIDSEASALMSEAKIVGDVVETWKEKWGKPYTFMFCVDRAHAQAQRARFEDAGIPFGYIDGTMSMDERYPVFVAYRKKEIMGIASVGCLSRGVDEAVFCIIDAKPKNSEMSYVQEIGRGLRNPERNGKELLVLDHAGNALRLGLPTDIHHERLDNRKAGDKTKPFAGDKPVPKPKRCKACLAVIPRLARKCPACGVAIVYESSVVSRDGELVEFGSGKKAAKHEYTDAEKYRWYQGLLYIARERGKSDGLAYHNFFAKFHHYPEYRKAPAEPTQEMKNWDSYRRLRYAKGMAKWKPKEVASAP